MRASLLQLEHPAVLKRLLKFPPVEDVHFLVERALQLCRRVTEAPPHLSSPSPDSPHSLPPPSQRQQQEEEQPEQPGSSSPLPEPPSPPLASALPAAPESGSPVAATRQSPPARRDGAGRHANTGVAACVPCEQLAEQMEGALQLLAVHVHGARDGLPPAAAQELLHALAKLQAVQTLLREAGAEGAS